MESGVNLLPTDYVTPALKEQAQVGQAILSDQIAEEEKKQTVFNKLLEVSLKDVKGKFRDEALQAKTNALSDLAKVFAKDSPITAQHMVKLQDEKDKLESLMGMAQGIESWYWQAANTAATIKDQTAREQTIANIQKIMEEGGSIKDTYQKIIKNDWLVHPPEQIDPISLKKQILDTVSMDLIQRNIIDQSKYGQVGFQEMYQAAPEEMQNMVDVTWRQHEQKLKNSGFQTKQQWQDFLGDKKTYGGTEYRTIPQTDTEVPHIPGMGYNPELPFINYNESIGGWVFADVNDGKGVPIASIEMRDEKGDKTGNTTQMAITKVQKGDDDRYYAHIAVPKSVTPEDITNKIQEGGSMRSEDVENIILMTVADKLLTARKDPVNTEEIKVPVEAVEGMILRNVNLLNYNYDPAGLGVEKYIPSNQTQAGQGGQNTADPAGIF